MTSDELRAAAERVRRCEAGENPKVVYGEQWDYAAMLESDRIDLADAYLAEHDETPLTRDWLCKVLGEPKGDYGGTKSYYWETQVNRVEWMNGCQRLDMLRLGPFAWTFVESAATRADAIAFFRLVKWPVDWAKVVKIWREEQEAPAACECGSGKPFSACCKTRITPQEAAKP